METYVSQTKVVIGHHYYVDVHICGNPCDVEQMVAECIDVREKKAEIKLVGGTGCFWVNIESLYKKFGGANTPRMTYEQARMVDMLE
jgi:hypothetical protein